MATRQWMWVKALTKEDKAEIALKCERFIAEMLTPRFLPKIRPTGFNYPVALFGKWRGDNYSFIQRYRSGYPENAGEEFNEAFARIDHVSGERFNLMWHRHTGQWLCLLPNLTQAEALTAMETEGLVHPR